MPLYVYGSERGSKIATSFQKLYPSPRVVLVVLIPVFFWGVLSSGCGICL